eukprot:TRINITY_DN1346_c0_g1_i11.p1 TRINITY_DN1346_c0_g1~~TRINITY_DN1346_c0_g1_i11.p1  ORF type:complete len:395 (-),score=111.16 TRINITY_DN1346_c0_g1_i11:185-1369(-)
MNPTQAQPPGQPQGNPSPASILGLKKITIILKSEMRYEGSLYQINPQDQNIALANVRCFGTEGRRPQDEVPPSSIVQDFLVFKGTEIKDIKVIDMPANAPGATQPPAQPGQQPQAPVPQTQQQPQPQAPSPPIAQPKEVQEQVSPSVKAKEQAPVKEVNEVPGVNAEGEGQNPLEEAKDKFVKPANNRTQDFYKKDNFFDSISTSTNTRARDTHVDREQQKRIDADTFGQEFIDQNRHKGGGRGHHHGGQRRGGYQSNYVRNRYGGGGGGGRGHGGYQGGSGGGYHGGGGGGYQGGGGGYQGGGYQGGGYQGGGGGGGYQGGGGYDNYYGGNNNSRPRTGGAYGGPRDGGPRDGGSREGGYRESGGGYREGGTGYRDEGNGGDYGSRQTSYRPK